MLSFLKSRGDAEPGSWLARLKQGLAKTRAQFGTRLAGVFGSGRKLDPAFYDELESALIAADVGIAATTELLAALRARAKRDGCTEASELRSALADALVALLR